MFAGRLYRTNRGFRVLGRKVDDLIERVGLDGKARRRVRALSGGERQRLGIAQALVGDPELLILDEPSAGLDPKGRREIVDLIDDLRGDTTVFYSTQILSVPTSVYVIRFRGEPDGLLERVSRQDWALGVAAVESDGLHEWSVELADVDPDRLLAEITSQPGRDVIAFHPAERRLEDAYLEIVGSDDGD